MNWGKNSKIRVLVIEDDITQKSALLNFFHSDTHIEICAVLSSGADITTNINLYSPDIILTDFLATDCNKTSILSKITSGEKTNRPKIMVMSSYESPSVMKKAFGYGIDYYIRKPVILSLLREAMHSVCYGKPYCAPEILKIKNLVRTVGIPTNILGYYYIVTALKYMVQTDRTMFLGEVYSYISKNNMTSTECVEVSVRNAVKKAILKHNDSFAELFGSTKKSVSNSLFLTTLKEVFFEKYSE